MGLYKNIARPLLFRLDPERAHRLALAAAERCSWAGRPLGRFAAIADERLESTIAGLFFPSPVGLAAGFDKNGVAVDLLAGFGFGSIEIGSVSAEFSAGNPRPRLFRLPEDRAVAVAYGVPNDGAAAVASRLRRTRLAVPLGVNIVKTNLGSGAPPESADAIIADYVASARLLAPIADYLMLNLSCPNTTDGRDFFVDRNHLDACLAALGGIGLAIPVFLKVSPLGGIETVERVLAAADGASFVSGFMFNLPPGKPAGLKTPQDIWRTMPGAVSGPPSRALAEFCIRETWRRMDRDRYCIIGAGGISSGADAYRMLKSGASLMQMLTALIYEGPSVVRRVTSELLHLMECDGVHRISEVVGVEAGHE